MGFTGKCLCGQASYRVGSDPVMTAICHCRNCQRQAGTAFSVIIGVPSEALEIWGETKIYADTADSGEVLQRKFCPECGSPIFSVLANAPQMTFIKAGTLDDVGMLQPQIQIWCKSAQPWVKLDPALPQFSENPPMQG